MSTSPYMPLYIADYLADAAHLTTEEHGAYLLLIMTYWQRGKALSADPKRLAAIARMTNERWTDVERTLSEFFTDVDGEWQHKRIEDELSKYRDKVGKAKSAGEASAKSRKPNKQAKDPQRTLNGRSTDAQRTCNHSESESESKLSSSSTVLVPKPRAIEVAAALPSDLIDRLTKAAGECLDNPVNCMGLLSGATPSMWLADGCDIELDIMATLKAAAVKYRGKRIRDWAYFSGMISEAKARRLAGMPKAVISAPKKQPVSTFAHPPKEREEDWQEEIAKQMIAEEQKWLREQQNSGVMQ